MYHKRLYCVCWDNLPKWFFIPPHVAFKQIKKQLCEFCNERRYFVFNFKTSYLCKKSVSKKYSFCFISEFWSLEKVRILEKVLKVTWAVHNSFRFVGMISKLQILPRIETKTTRESISFGIVSWETLGKTYCTADPSQNSNEHISKGNFFWRSCLGDFK